MNPKALIFTVVFISSAHVFAEEQHERMDNGLAKVTANTVDIAKLFDALMRSKPPLVSEFENEAQYKTRLDQWKKNAKLPVDPSAPVEVSTTIVGSWSPEGKIEYIGYEIPTSTLRFIFKGYSHCDFPIKPAPKGLSSSTGLAQSQFGATVEIAKLLTRQYCIKSANSTRPDSSFVYSVHVNPQEAKFLSTQMKVSLRGFLKPPFTEESLTQRDATFKHRVQSTSVSLSVLLAVTEISFIHPRSKQVLAIFDLAE